jgi:hypothetical protein
VTPLAELAKGLAQRATRRRPAPARDEPSAALLALIRFVTAHPQLRELVVAIRVDRRELSAGSGSVHVEVECDRRRPYLASWSYPLHAVIPDADPRDPLRHALSWRGRSLRICFSDDESDESIAFAYQLYGRGDTLDDVLERLKGERRPP